MQRNTPFFVSTVHHDGKENNFFPSTSNITQKRTENISYTGEEKAQHNLSPPPPIFSLLSNYIKSNLGGSPLKWPPLLWD